MPVLYEEALLCWCCLVVCQGWRRLVGRVRTTPIAEGHHWAPNPSRRVLPVAQLAAGPMTADAARTLCLAEGCAWESGLCHLLASLPGNRNVLPAECSINSMHQTLHICIHTHTTHTHCLGSRYQEHPVQTLLLTSAVFFSGYKSYWIVWTGSSLAIYVHNVNLNNQHELCTYLPTYIYSHSGLLPHMVHIQQTYTSHTSCISCHTISTAATPGWVSVFISFTTPNSQSPLCFTFTRQPFSRAVGSGTINRESLHDTKLARDIPV